MKLINKLKVFLVLAASALISGCVSTKSLSLEAYRDSRGMNVGTLTGASETAGKTNVFGFIEYETEQGTDNIKRPYGEIMFSKKAKNGLGVAAEYNRNFALPKGVTRTGFIFEPRVRKDLFLGLKYFPSSTDDHGQQVGIYGKKTFNKGDIYIKGYFDYNFKPDKTVTDLQIGKRMGKNLYFIVEGRLNQFRSKGDQKGIGIGLEFRFK